MTDLPCKRHSLDAGKVDQARDWVARLGSGDITSAELAALRTWLADDEDNARAFEQERALWQDVAVIAASLGETPAGHRRKDGMRRWSPRRLRQAIGGAIAASLLVMATAPHFYLMMRSDYRTGTGERQTASLPDGSQVVLDSNSAIALAYDGNERRIELLRGRAWFDVKHDDARPFRVVAQGGVTQDVGTAFAVERDEDGVGVGVSAGVVRVFAPDGRGERVTLEAGERVHYRPGERVERLASADSTSIAAWRSGALLLHEMPLSRAVQEIGRYRSAPIFTFGDLDAAQPVSGIYRTDRPDDALATIAAMRELRIRTLPGGILIVQPKAPS
ncbi:FecR domain-containing protein (plasmid) [Novosphingobium sp. BL-8A]|uniref:FecR family protein n=1 Tax=Novosphingobium sp. BL-8A TaxID=3127639 RepID=UPI0037571D6E